MDSNPVKIPRQLVNSLLHQAQSGGDKEICGLIAARGGHPQRVIPIANVAPTPATRYQMDPKAQIDAMRDMRQRDETLFAVYHSHPHSPAVPSAVDAAEAGYPEALYLIISLSVKGTLEMRGYRMADGAFKEVLLEIE